MNIHEVVDNPALYMTLNFVDEEFTTLIEDFDEGEIFVICFIKRLIGPFVMMDSLLEVIYCFIGVDTLVVRACDLDLLQRSSITSYVHEVLINNFIVDWFWLILAQFMVGIIAIHLQLLLYFENEMMHLTTILFMRGMDPLVLHSQYHGCWWPGNVRSQGICRNDIDSALLKYSKLKPEGVNRADSRFAPSQWEMTLLCNDVSH